MKKEQRGRKRRRPGEARSKLFPISVFDSEIEFIKRQAYAFGISASEYIRTCSLPPGWESLLIELRQVQGLLTGLPGRPQRRRRFKSRGS